MTFSSTKKLSGYILTATASLTLIACGGDSSNDADAPKVITKYSDDVTLGESAYAGDLHTVQLNQRISGTHNGLGPTHKYQFTSPVTELLIFKVDGGSGSDFDIIVTNETTSEFFYGETYADDETLLIEASANDVFSVAIDHFDGAADEDYTFTLSQLSRDVLNLGTGEYLIYARSQDVGTCNPSDGSIYNISSKIEDFVILNLNSGGFHTFYENNEPGYSVTYNHSNYMISDTGFSGTTIMNEIAKDGDETADHKLTFSISGTFSADRKSMDVESKNTYKIQEYIDDTLAWSNDCNSVETGTFEFLL